MVLRAAALLAVLMWSALAAAAPVVGSVKTAAGACFVVRGGAERPVQAGERLFGEDLLRTGADGRLGALLRDDTSLALGPDSELELARFAFDPAHGRLEMVLRLLRGVCSYLSGQIARLAPDAVRFETPVATVGVRGTRFLARVEPQ